MTPGENKHKIALDKAFVRKMDLYMTDFPTTKWSEWSQLKDEDKKILAILYWEKLTDEMKDEFYDPGFIEAQRKTMNMLKERYTNPMKIKEHFLLQCGPITDMMIDAATNPEKKVHMNEYAMNEVWGIIKNIIATASSPAPLLDLKGGTIGDQIDKILTEVSIGKISFDEAKEYMSLVSQGFNIQELPKIMAQLEKLEN